MIRHWLVNRTLSNRISYPLKNPRVESAKEARKKRVFVGKFFFFFSSSFFLQDWLADKHLDELIIDRPEFWRLKRDCLLRERIVRYLFLLFVTEREREVRGIRTRSIWSRFGGWRWDSSCDSWLGVSRIIEFLCRNEPYVLEIHKLLGKLSVISRFDSIKFNFINRKLLSISLPFPILLNSQTGVPYFLYILLPS